MQHHRQILSNKKYKMGRILHKYPLGRFSWICARLLYIVAIFIYYKIKHDTTQIISALNTATANQSEKKTHVKERNKLKAEKYTERMKRLTDKREHIVAQRVSQRRIIFAAICNFSFIYLLSFLLFSILFSL
jgi:hypothetical protein